MTIVIDGKDYPLTPQQYLLSDVASVTCAIGISSIPANLNYTILGATFLRNYYASLNYVSSTVSLAVSKHPATENATLDNWEIAGITLGAIILVGLVVYGVCWWKKRN